jgi:uncharacterized membrane protein SirB2
MVLGMSLATFTFVHVLISLIGIGSGLVVAYGLLAAKPLDGWTATFLATTTLTSLTGFLFPVEHLLPSHIVGIISLVILALAIFARYGGHLTGSWRCIYIVSSVIALYLNCFVAVVQSFMKIPALKALAPTQKEPPFLIAQIALMVLFIVLGIFAVRNFRVTRLAAA